MNNSLKTVLLIFVGAMLLVSILAMTRFRSLRLMSIESPQEEDRLRRQMRFLIIIMSLITMCMLIISIYILLRYFNG